MRRAVEWNIETYSDVTDSTLDTIISQYLEDFPWAGEAMTRGYLQSINVHIQRERMRLSILRVLGEIHLPSLGYVDELTQFLGLTTYGILP